MEWRLSSFMHVLALIIRLYVLPISEEEFIGGVVHCRYS